MRDPAQRARIARLRERQRPVRAAVDLRAVPEADRSAALTRAVERVVLRDARRRVRADELDGPIRSADCEPADPPGAPPDLRLACTAVTFATAAARSGHPYLARGDLRTGRFAACLVEPVGGEGAGSASTLLEPPPAACRGE